MKCVWLGCLLAATALVIVSAEDGSCSSHSTCGNCITSPNCHWCSASMIGRSRCVHTKQTKDNWCQGIPLKFEKSMHIVNPGTVNSWLTPEHVRVKLRVREELKFILTYRRVDDYPVDLYYLMDLSYSMKDDKENLSKLGDKLAAVMTKITRNFRLGFGSFVDKVAMPFVNTHPNKLKNPCSETCAPAYSFKNHLALTNKTEQFSLMVEQTPVSGNVDFPEGGFDALMQAIVCTDEIKWRHHARHLLVLATDANFHIAGDGKLAGIVEPNDEKCHMKNNEYTERESLKYDYPSISQLNRQAKNKSITLIFAVTSQVENIYKSLVEHIKGSDMGTLSNDSMNVIDLVQGVYEKLVESVQMNDDSESKGVSISYKTSCSEDLGVPSESNICPEIHAGKNIMFEVTVKVPKCPPNSGEVWKERITIKPNGIDENMVIDLEVQCGCLCERAGNLGYVKNSPQCKNHGDEKCGMCVCNNDYTGKLCECAIDHFTKNQSTESCVSNDLNREICNNRGSCVCNVCNCTRRQNPEEEVYGPLCECDNFSCVRFDGKLCSGPEKGLCDCGRCICNPGWRGEACNCPVSVDTCRAPGTVALCSGVGKCECGICKCDKGHYGKYCEDCMTCPGGRCKSFAKCVEYLVYNEREYDEALCVPKNITLQETRKHIKEEIREGDEKFCRHPDDSGCSFVFTYLENGTDIIIIAEEEKQCPAAVNLLGIIFGVIGGTVLLGLLTILIWKLLTSIHDRREFAKFEKERAQSKWERGDNPLYVQATSTFSNPTFSGN